MRRLFVDTGALIALASRSDDHHEAASEFFRRHGASSRWVTSDFVLDEVATRLRAELGAAAAVRFVRAVRASALYEVHAIETETFDESLTLMAKYSDHKLSLTDCTSFVLMRELDLGEVFGFDRDFVSCGFVLVP